MIIKDLLTGFLDAYLVRQDLEGAASFLSVQFVGLGMDAVSYTHLDVYKRQMLY